MVVQNCPYWNETEEQCETVEIIQNYCELGLNCLKKCPHSFTEDEEEKVNEIYEDYCNDLLNIENPKQTESFCLGGCGIKITKVERHNNLYCNNFCCSCCPDAKNSPCQKDKKEGSLIDNLYNLQTQYK